MAVEVIAHLPRFSLSARTFMILLLCLASPTHGVYQSHGDTIDDEVAANAGALQLETDCKVLALGVPSLEAIDQLKACTKALEEKLAQTKEQRTSSTEANGEYSKQFQAVLGLLKTLQDKAQMDGAFGDGQNKARDFLIAETEKIESKIQELQEVH
mmetsp:Transcript_22402/g.42864  ORF Transcript_22402/g.42864 Transcript_22402/m.42864 type:complete len:156 (+) Transcript_22402:77-544(+)